MKLNYNDIKNLYSLKKITLEEIYSKDLNNIILYFPQKFQWKDKLPIILIKNNKKYYIPEKLIKIKNDSEIYINNNIDERFTCRSIF